MKYLPQFSKAYFAANKLRILWWAIGVIVSVLIVGLFLAILPWLLGLGCVLLIGYKFFTGFPSIFGTLTQILALCVLVACVFSLCVQKHPEHQQMAAGYYVMLRDQYGVPEVLIKSIITESGALLGIVISLGAGLLGEIASGLTANSFFTHCLGDKIKTK